MAEDQKARMRRNRARIWYYAAAAYAASTSTVANVQYDFAGAQMSVAPTYGDFTTSTAVFSPTSLFTTEKGLIWDFTDPTQLRQNTSGTGTVSTAGQGARLVLDQSPNAFNGTFDAGGAISASFTSSAGFYFVLSQVESFSATQSAVRAMLESKTFITLIQSVDWPAGSNPNNFFGPRFTVAGTTMTYAHRVALLSFGVVRVRHPNDGFDSDIVTGLNISATGYTAHMHSEWDFTGGVYRVYINNVLTHCNTFTAGVSPIGTGTIQFQTNGTTGNRLHYGVLIDRQLTSTERDNMYAWGRAKLNI